MRAVFARRRRETRRVLWASPRCGSNALRDVASNARRVHVELLRPGRALRGPLVPQRTRLHRSPSSLVAALGVGATTAAFSVTDHVLVRPLPFREPHRLVKLWQDQPQRGYSRMELSPANYRDWKRLSTSFEGMGDVAQHLREPRREPASPSGSTATRSRRTSSRCWASSRSLAAASRRTTTARARPAPWC